MSEDCTYIEKKSAGDKYIDLYRNIAVYAEFVYKDVWMEEFTTFPCYCSARASALSHVIGFYELCFQYFCVILDLSAFFITNKF